MEISKLKPKLFAFLSKHGFKRISDAIELTWGSKECDSYLSRLIFDPSRDSRQGFPMPVFQVILKLYNLHSKEFGTDKLSQSGNRIDDWTYK